MTLVDPSRAQLFPGFPTWLRRRLRRLYVNFVLGNEDKGMPVVRRVYAALNDGDGCHLSQRHLELLGRAWLAVGPGVPEPPPHRVACVVAVLAELELEDSLLEGWLLSLLGETLRGDVWPEDSEDFKALRQLLHGRRLRRYREWLMEGIRMHGVPIAQVDSAWKRDVVASRVLIELCTGYRLDALADHVNAWEALHPSEWSELQEMSDGVLRELVPGIGSRNPEKVLRSLWIKCASR